MFFKNFYFQMTVNFLVSGALAYMATCHSRGLAVGVFVFFLVFGVGCKLIIEPGLTTLILLSLLIIPTAIGAMSGGSTPGILFGMSVGLIVFFVGIRLLDAMEER